MSCNSGGKSVPNKIEKIEKEQKTENTKMLETGDKSNKKQRTSKLKTTQNCLKTANEESKSKPKQARQREQKHVYLKRVSKCLYGCKQKSGFVI